LKHIGGYFDRADVEKFAVLRARLGLDNSQLIKLAIDELYRKHEAKRVLGISDAYQKSAGALIPPLRSAPLIDQACTMRASLERKALVFEKLSWASSPLRRPAGDLRLQQWLLHFTKVRLQRK
jgi:hypothetical protein